MRTISPEEVAPVPEIDAEFVACDGARYGLGPCQLVCEDHGWIFRSTEPPALGVCGFHDTKREACHNCMQVVGLECIQFDNEQEMKEWMEKARMKS